MALYRAHRSFGQEAVHDEVVPREGLSGKALALAGNRDPTLNRSRRRIVTWIDGSRYREMGVAVNGFVSLVGSLAWPLAIMTVAVLFRTELSMALSRVGHVKYRDIEVTFRDDLRQAEALANSIPTAPGKGKVVLEVNSSDPQDIGGQLVGQPKVESEPVSKDRGRRGREVLARLASFSPRDAVLEAWDEVCQSLLKAATKLGDRRGPVLTRADDASRFLVDRGWIVGPEAQLVERLRMIRDRVGQRDELAPSPDEARRYIDLALPVAARIDALT